MRVRAEQLNAMVLQDFAVRFRRVLVEHFPDAQEVPWDLLLDSVKRQIANAARYGFITEQDAATYALTAWLLGENFDAEIPAVRQILHSDEDAEGRAARLAQWTADLFNVLDESE